MIKNKLIEWAAANNYRIAFGKIDLVNKAIEILEERLKKGELNSKFFDAWLSVISNQIDSKKKRDWSLIMVAVPRPGHVLKFKHSGIDYEAIFPPTYGEYKPIIENVRAEIAENAVLTGWKVEDPDLPMKTLAVLTGLAVYGRNNIAYVNGMGSYGQLVGLITDAPLETDDIDDDRNIEDRLMSKCNNCHACMNACPTGAISNDRVLLYAEKCYTMLSETPGDMLSDLIPPSPECIIGCMRCQMVCPVNRGLLRYEPVKILLNEDETDFLLSGEALDSKQGKAIKAIFDQLKLSEYFSIYARNFRRLVSICCDRKA